MSKLSVLCSPGSRLLRKGVPGYSDGAYEMAGQNRPNPLDISQHVHSGKGGEQSSFGRNAMLVFFSASLSVYLSVYLSLFLSVCLSVCLCLCLSPSLSLSLSLQDAIDRDIFTLLSLSFISVK